MSIAYWNESNNKMGFIDNKQDGFVTIENRRVYVKPHGIESMNLTLIEGVMCSVTGMKLMHVQMTLFIPNLDYLSHFKNLQDRIENGYKVNIYLGDECVYSHLLIDVCTHIVNLNFSHLKTNVDTEQLRFETGYTDLKFLNGKIILTSY